MLDWSETLEEPGSVFPGQFMFPNAEDKPAAFTQSVIYATACRAEVLAKADRGQAIDSGEPERADREDAVDSF